MVHELRNQPFRGLYLAYQLFTTTLLRYPLWVLLALPRSWRPRASWSLGRCLKVRLIRHLSGVNDKVVLSPSHTNHLAIPNDNNAGEKALWIDPAPELIHGELLNWASITGVTPIRIPGYWIERRGVDMAVGAPLQPGEKILYRLHGGGYVGLSAHPSDPSTAISRDLMHFCAPFKRTFAIEYRLSKAAPYVPANPFPAALFDALAGYSYLVNSAGFRPEDIVVEGDSAGGNLALALVRYLVESQESPCVPAPPGGMILLSPWTDISVSHETTDSSMLSSIGSDTLGTGLNGRAAYPKLAFLGALGLSAAESNAYISPASLHLRCSFKNFPRTFVCAGGAEMFVDQIRTLVARMAGDMGEGAGMGQVVYYEASDGVHVYPAFDFHEPERSETYRAIAQWVAAEQ
ncbi:Alpha/Beta hydrolase protein [Hygrophoropsis aurantiaca]|uniref:Alpha/Beta hydrolase protein n=1 Tax=Hygrophoropsis aurantiaca TaxID=72124 RepID=A0ACB8A5N3_9AGAM|nr:Alpha/Beta hydrolase protein [Hygrophoropsis aurantiaca]